MTTDPTPPAEPLPIVLRVGDLTFELEEGRAVVIGSSPDVDVRIAHGTVSRRHAELELQGLQVRVRDLDSTNGTWHGGARIDVATLGLGSALRFGEISATVEQFVPTVSVAPDPGIAPHRLHEPSFHELMAEQLRRAPWFAISIVFHVVVLLLLQMFLIDHIPPGERRIALTLSPDEVTEEIADDPVDVEPIQLDEVDEDLVLQDLVEDTKFDEPESDNAVFDDSTFSADWDARSMLSKIRTAVSDDVLREMQSSEATESFRKTVTGLRQSGLDIVFVFDSTYSMDTVLDQTKQRIALMVDVLYALVRNARIGIVTYRDHDEEYLTRHIPLASDYYRSVNFMQTVFAGGGGDVPEAVYEALQVAFRSKWRKGARRIVVLIGDAPAHNEDASRLRALVSRFEDERSTVHAIMTKRMDGMIDPSTAKNFHSIAEAGGGSCIPLEDERAILRDIIALAIGRDFKRDVDQVYSLVDRRRETVDRTAAKIIADEDVEAMSRALTKSKPDDDVIRALTKSHSARLAHGLVDLMRAQATPKRTRHAAAYALQRMLSLATPPIDPESERPLDPRSASRLLNRIERDLR
ncbi:MAG: FHA domain-containing protein [Planctomycetes bacterium]|nr:FHA domain-containing protein [Planctomycetota bacterium]